MDCRTSSQSMFSTVRQSWHLYSALEKRNIAIYIVGIMLYKFGLEAFNGSIVALATNRYDFDAKRAGTTPKTFERLGVLTGLNQAFQCVGSILIAPLIKRYPTKNVLSMAILVFGLFTALLLIVDASTGGTIIPKDWKKTHKKDDFSYYGDYNTDGMIPIYCVTGVAYGMVELIRRVIPRDIVGGDVMKLRQMDATVHIFYEVAGTSGAFATALGLIPTLGNNFSFIITPIFFTIGAIVWWFISGVGEAKEGRPKVESLEHIENSDVGYCQQISGSISLFHKSIWTGGKLIFTNRQYFWLLPGYSVALYAHRYLENGICPAIAKRYLGNSAWSQIMVGGSNFGEFLGAVFVFLFTNLVHTPLPWLRLDSLMLLIVWYLPYWYPPQYEVKYAWLVAATFIPVSFGWASGDVSLAAYIQASLARHENVSSEVSALGAVMAFLYSTYIVTYAVTSPLLGKYLDRVSARTGGIHEGITNVAGVQFTIVFIIIMTASFLPKGAFKLNPKMLNDEPLRDEEELEDFDKAKKNEKQIEAEISYIVT